MYNRHADISLLNYLYGSVTVRHEDHGGNVLSLEIVGEVSLASCQLVGLRCRESRGMDMVGMVVLYTDKLLAEWG